MKEVNYYGRSVGEEIAERKSYRIKSVSSPIKVLLITYLLCLAGLFLFSILLANDLVNYLKYGVS